MHVGLIIYGDLEVISGGYLYDKVLVEHLQGAGDTVEVVSLPWRDYTRHLTDNFSSALHKRLRAAKFDVLIQDELNNPSLFQLNHNLRRQIDYPIVSIVHHLRSSEYRPAWQNALYRQIERVYLRSVDGFIFNSQTTQGVVEELVGSRRPAVVAYPAGDRWQIDITPEDIATRARADGPLRILFIGNIIARKGLHTLLNALALLSKQSWQLTIIGSPEVDPDYARSINRQIEQHGLADRITLTGALHGDAIAGHYRASHLLVVPSTYEGFGIVYLEGMGFGLPAIASTAGAAHEIITPGQDGFLIEPGDAETLAQHIRELNTDRDRLLNMSLAARSRFHRHPTWEASAGSVRQFLLSLTE